MRKRLILVVIAVGLAAGLVVIGRIERRDSRANIVRGIEEVRAAIGPSLVKPGPTDYEISHLGCLLYGWHGRPYALELCVDGPQNRVVEAIDRRGRTAKIYSLVGQEDAAPLKLAPAETYLAWIKRIDERAHRGRQ